MKRGGVALRDRCRGACVVSQEFFESAEILARTAAINDSKQMSAEAREALFQLMEQLKEEGHLDFAVAEGSVALIAERNILGATRIAMQLAVEALSHRAKEWALPLAAAAGPLFEFGGKERLRMLVDGRPLKPFPYRHTALVKGDGRSFVIAMASIAAKVSRIAGCRCWSRNILVMALRSTKAMGLQHIGQPCGN